MNKVRFYNNKNPEDMANLLSIVATKFLVRETFESYKANKFLPGMTAQQYFLRDKWEDGAQCYHYNSLPWRPPVWWWKRPGMLYFVVTAHDMIYKRKALVQFEILASGGRARVDPSYIGKAKELFEYLLNEYRAAYPEAEEMSILQVDVRHKIRELALAGKSDIEIGYEVGLGHDRVKQLRLEMGIKRRRGRQKGI